MTTKLVPAGKAGKITYWISTAWLALGMLSSGIMQLLKGEAEVDFILKMGYPGYFLTVLGVWKILGAVVVLLPKFPLLKEWAYAGFFFAMSGAVFSHIALGHRMSEIAGPLLLLMLTLVSWYFRPANRKIIALHQPKEIQPGALRQ